MSVYNKGRNFPYVINVGKNRRLTENPSLIYPSPAKFCSLTEKFSLSLNLLPLPLVTFSIIGGFHEI